MASTSATAPPPEVLEEIRLLFAWNPPRLTLAHKPSPKKSSTAARSPAFYDKHFSSRLVVKKVVWLPSLVQDLARNVDKILGALETLPPLGDFFTATDRAFDERRFPTVMTDEKAVVEFYCRTTANYCSFVASTLALHPSFPRWGSLLVWTQSASSSDYAIPDGRLLFIEEGDNDVDVSRDERAAIAESMDSRSRAFFEGVRKSKSPLATWEMKNLTTEVMTAIRDMGEFSWTFCTANDCDTNPKHLRQQELVDLAGQSVGPDAQTTPWSLPGPATRRVTRSAAASGSSTLHLPLLALRSSDLGSPMKDKGKKRARDDEEDRHESHDTTAQSGSSSSMLPLPPSTSRLSKRGSPMKDKGKKRTRDDEEDWHDTTAQSGSGSSMLSQPLSTSRLSKRGSPTKDKGKKRARDDEEDWHDTTAQSGPGSSMLPPPPSTSRLSKHGSPTKDKGKKRKLEDKHDITAKKLVQQVMCSIMPVKILMCQLYAGMGTSRTSRRDSHCPSLRQPRACVCPPSTLSDTLCFGRLRTI